MKVFFDGGIFSRQKIGGISRVGFELMKELGKKKDIEQIFYRGFYIDNYSFEKEWFSKYYGMKKPDFLKGRIFNLLDNIGVNYFYNINADKNLIYHSLYYRVPKKPKGPVVVHCYDMIQELFGGNLKTIRYKKKSFDKADLIIAISESTKKDLCKLYSIDSEKVIVAYPGVSQTFLKGCELIKREKERPYMLYVGARNYKYKNFNFLLDIFIKKKYFLDFNFILVGGEKDLTPEQKIKIKNTVGSGSWFLQKFCDDEKLAELYSGATVFVYPSLYEGFGIPPLEAMACGCPVVASNASSIPETVGDAGLLFDPDDADDLIKQIEKIITDKPTALNLIEKGKIRAKKFGWDDMADIIYQGYLKL